MDFWTDIDTWIEAGEKLIIGGDWNRNVYDKNMRDEFASRGRRPVITSQHAGAPETYSDGSYPIDEIFATDSLEIHKCGFLEHGANKSDH